MRLTRHEREKVPDFCSLLKAVIASDECFFKRRARGFCTDRSEELFKAKLGENNNC